jgi:MoaD family protein
VRVKFFFFVRRAAGTDAIDVPASTAPDVQSLMHMLVQKYGPAMRDEVMDERGAVRRDLNILVNGRNIEFLDGVQTRLVDTDVVSVLSPVAGG